MNHTLHDQIRYTCWGAARQVTGSMHLLTTPSGFNILIDCGLDYEKRDQFEARNAAFPFDVSSINLVILTHAHIDHSGNMPNLVRQGFHGQVLCTGPTRELSEFLLKDSLNIQRAELARHQQGGHRQGKKKKGRKFGPERQPLYSAVNIRDLMAQCVEMPFRKVRRINEEVSIEFFPAGHILGAASVAISIETPNGTRRVGFTGDLGNWNSPLVVDPEPMPDLDYLISESTYGGRLHQNLNDPMDELSQYIEDTCVKYNGKLVIPAFSVGRTQSILYTLNRMQAAGRLPKVRVFTDSPLAIKSTQVYARYVEQLNEDARHFANEGRALFEFPGLQVIEDELSTEIISSYNEPVIIVSSAGMVEGGRIQEHVRRNIQNPFATILIAGYCAEGTLGHRLLHGQRTVEINRTEREVYARVSRTDVFSAHPDHKGLMRYLEGVQNPALKGIFLVHGDATCMEALQKEISFTQAHIPGKGQQYELN